MHSYLCVKSPTIPPAGSDSVLKRSLPEECQSACVCALTKLQELFDNIQSGNISMRDLRKIMKCEEKVKVLYESVGVQSGQAIRNVAYSKVHGYLNLRKSEYEHFTSIRSYLLNLAKYLTISGEPILPGRFLCRVLYLSQYNHNELFFLLEVC